MSTFIVRVRHSKGTTRFELANKSSTTIKQLKQLICQKLAAKPPISTQQLTINGKSTDIPFTNNSTLSSLNIKHGDMFYLKIIKSAIICQSHNNNNNNNSTSRKRKFNEIDSSDNSTLPPKKRTRLNKKNNNHNHNNSSFVVHTLSDNSNTSQTTQQTTSNTNKNTTNTRKKPVKKKASKKKAKKKKDQFLVIKSEGDTIDEIVNNYFSDSKHSNQLKIALQILPIEMQKMYTQQARIEAILDEKVEVTEYLERSRFTSKTKSRGKRYLIVNYSFKRKKRKEVVCFYNDDKIQEIISNLIWKSVQENERELMFVKNKINHQNIVEVVKRNKLILNEIANRSPPLLWSLFHSFPNQKIENVLVKFVKVALKELRIKTRDIQQDNDNQ